MPQPTPKYGFPAAFWRTIERRRPPGPDPAKAFRSPLRGPWLTSIFGLVLLCSLPLVIITGLLDYIAYSPQFGQSLPGHVGFLAFGRRFLQRPFRLLLLPLPAEPAHFFQQQLGTLGELALQFPPVARWGVSDRAVQQ